MDESQAVKIARIEEKIDGIVDRLDRRESTDDTARVLLGVSTKELEVRVATLERWRSALIGGSAAVGAVASTFVHILLSLIH